MDRHRRWSWSLIAPLPCRDGILFHRGIRYVCRQTNWTQATPRRHLLAQDGTRGPAPGAMTTHNGHGSTRAGWYAALVGSLLSARLLMAACAPRMGGPSSWVQDKPVGAVQHEASRGAPLSGTDACTWSEVLGKCRVHNE